jgi:hypothetical protein
MPWFIRYTFYQNLQFLNHVIIIKTKVLLPQAYVTLPCLDPLVYLLPKLLNYLAF